MNTSPIRNTLILQSLVLLGGTIFAWSNFLPLVSHFYALYGTLARVAGCTIPNPFLTPCFYGSFAFLVALLWSVSIYERPSLVQERRLRNFLLLCVVFAGSVVAYEAAQYYKIISDAVSVSCTPGASPFKTSCFYGTFIFIAAYIAAIVATRRLSTSDTVA